MRGSEDEVTKTAARPGFMSCHNGRAGPTTSPVITEENEASCAANALHVSWPRQASLGPRRFASIDNFSVPIVGPGATVGTVETRVPRAGLPKAHDRTPLEFR